MLYLSIVCAGILATSAAQAVDFSFRGTFSQDDNVQLFSFLVRAPSTVTLRTYSYAGGVQADGTVIPAGGFDPVLALFDSAGILIDQNDDGNSVPSDPNTGVAWDTGLQADLTAGDYTVAVTQYDNFAIGSTLTDGFVHQGQGNFTPVAAVDCLARAFCDVSGVSNFNERTNAWAFDILNVDQAGTPNVPLPASLPLLAAGLFLMATLRRRKQ